MKRLKAAIRGALFAVLLLSLLTPAVLLSGCASPGKTVTSDPEANALLFPNGSYIHQVRLKIPSNPDPKKRDFEFRGAVKITPDVIRIVMLSPMGTTLLKLSEDRATEKVSVESYVPQLKPYEAKMVDYYASLRVLLTAPRHPEAKAGYQLDESERPLALERKIEGVPTHFAFAAYDEHQIPTRLRVENERFFVEVQVLGYDL